MIMGVTRSHLAQKNHANRQNGELAASNHYRNKINSLLHIYFSSPLRAFLMWRIGGVLVAGQGGSEDEQSEEVGGFAFVAQAQASVSHQPGHHPFDDPAVPPAECDGRTDQANASSHGVTSG
jgi:hypothetical protein